MRTRFTANLTACAVAASAAVFPVTTTQAHAAPTTAVRTSAHGQLLCTVAPSAADKSAAAAVRAGYAETLQAAALEVRSLHPSINFGNPTSLDVTSLPAYGALLKEGYTPADAAVILVAATAPEKIISSDLESQLLVDRLERSLNGSIEQAKGYSAQADNPRAVLLSSGEDFSPAFREILSRHEAGLRSAVAAFEKEAGNQAVADAWNSCVTQLKAKGAQPGVQEVPVIEIPDTAPTTANRIDGPAGASGSSVGFGIFAGIAVIAAALFGASQILNAGGVPAFTLPQI